MALSRKGLTLDEVKNKAQQVNTTQSRVAQIKIRVKFLRF